LVLENGKVEGEEEAGDDNENRWKPIKCGVGDS
jgi:hypothetical protein